MPKFANFKSMLDDPPPSKDRLLEMVVKFEEPLVMLYVRHHYDAFFAERYPHGPSLQGTPKDQWTFDFDTRMTKAEDEELRSMCQGLALNFLMDMITGVNDILDREEDVLDALYADLDELAVAFDGALTDSKLNVVQNVFEHWRGDAGETIREHYSNHFTKSTQTHTEMARALANAAKLEALIFLKVRHHLDGLIRDVAQTIDHGPAASNLNLDPILNWLTVLGVVASIPGGPAVMSTVGWVGSTIKTILTELPLEETDQPVMDSTDPDELRAQVNAAFAQVADVVRADREKLAGELIESFGLVEELLNSDDPARSSRVVPNPNGVNGIRL